MAAATVDSGHLDCEGMGFVHDRCATQKFTRGLKRVSIYPVPEPGQLNAQIDIVRRQGAAALGDPGAELGRRAGSTGSTVSPVRCSSSTRAS